MHFDLSLNEKDNPRKVNPLRHRFSKGIGTLPPDSFSLVMATGIISIASHIFGYLLLSQLLFYLNIAFYIILFILFGAQIVFYWKRFRSRFFNLEINMGFLTFVAANCILGSQFITISNHYTLGIIFLSIGFLSWIFLLYSLFAIHIEKRYKSSIKVISGTWLLVVVATQAIAILCIQLVDQIPISHKAVLLFSLLMFLIGCLFYIILITLIIYRLLFFEVRAQKLKTPYWISMGADAITVLSGTTLIMIANKWSVLSELLPFLKGLTLLFWGIGTWWIPLMVLLGIWRHLIKKIRVKYVSHYWGMVFPLGMYTVCTVKLSETFDLPFLMSIPNVFLIISLVTWTLVFMGMLRRIIK